jgi:possible type I site-specific deoxyribonuclease specificity subunit
MKIFNKNEWKKVKLGDVCEVITGNTPLKKIKEYWDKDEVPFITPPELKYEGINYITPNIYVSKIGAKQGRIIPKNSICVCCIGSLGKLGILKEDAITNQQINSLILKDKNVDLLYLYFYLKTIKNNLESIASSTTVKIINKSSFEKIDINLPSLEIQKKICKKLELLENNINFRKSQLNSLNELSKSLFTIMFGDIKSNSKNWKIYKFSEKLNISSGGTPSKSNKTYWENGTISWIGSNMCNDKIIIQNDGKFITEEGLKNSSAKIYKPNTVIVALVGATIGKTGLLKFETSTNQNIAALEIKNIDYSPEFLFFLLQNLYYKFNELGGDTFKMANLSFIRNLPLVSPPIELQNKFAERIEKIEKLKFEIEKSIEIAQNLYDSLISKYFDN